MAKRNTKRTKNHKHVLALLAPLLLGGGSLSAQQIDATGDVSPTPGGSPWSIGGAGYLYVGNTSDGSLTITNGGQINNLHTVIANAAGTIGSAIVDGSGGGGTWNNAYSFVIGLEGTGSLAIQNGGQVTSGQMTIGYYSGGTGTVTVDGIGSALTLNALFVESGTLTVQNQGQLNSGSYNNIGYDNLAGTVVIDGNGSTWTYTSLQIGNYGNFSSNKSELIIRDGGYVLAEGDGASLMQTDARITVEGTGSTWITGYLSLCGELNVIDNGKVITTTANIGNWNPGELTISRGGQMSIEDAYIGVSYAASVTVDGAGGGATLTTDNLYIGFAEWTDEGWPEYYADGSLTIKNGGKVINSGDAYIAFNDVENEGSDAKGTVTVDGTGSTWTNTGNLYVGHGGDGTLHITNTGQVTNADGYIGYEADSTGTVTVEGATSMWTNTGALYVGYEGTGELNITTAAMVRCVGGSIGTMEGSSGIVNVDGRAIAIWMNTGTLHVGDAGTGVLNITNGGNVSSVNAAYVGNEIGSSGTVTVAGGSWSSNAAIYIGVAGSGELTANARVTSASGYIGVAETGTGTVTVDGAGTWTITNELVIGGQGTGELNITNGGKVTSKDGYIAAETGSTGKVTVDGSGSSWSNTSGGSGNLYVGYEGDGELTITDGGKVITSGAGAIAAETGSTGTVLVEGAGSSWTMTSGHLTIGSGGDGELTIANGGYVKNRDGYVRSSSKVTVDGGTWDNLSTLSASGELNIKNGGIVNSQSASSVNATVDGPGSAWNNDGTRGIAGTLTITNGGYVSNTQALLYTQTIVTVDGDGSTWTNNGILMLDGKLTITDGGLVNCSMTYFGTVAGSDIGNATVDGTGSTWTNTQGLYVGYNGNGSLAITNGGTVTNTDGNIGYRTGSTGTVTVDGPDSTWTNDGGLYVGYEGHGELHITNGGQVTSYDVQIGVEFAGVGTIIVDGPGSTWDNNSDGWLYVGVNGEGNLTITNGGQVINGYCVIAASATSTGTVIVDGVGSTFTNTHSITVLGNGPGTLAITNGGQVTSTDGTIRGNGSTPGLATVDGEGSAWNIAGEFVVGNWGLGNLAITNGGTVTNTGSFSIIGCSTAATVNVDGKDANGVASSFTNAGNLYIGYAEWTDPDAPEYYAVGTLTITNGGRVSNADAFIAYNGEEGFDAIGTVTVDGSGSTWTNANLHIGHSGSGELTLRNTAIVTADFTILATETSSGGLLTIGSAPYDEPVAPGTLDTPVVAFGEGAAHIIFNHTDLSGEYEFTPFITDLPDANSSSGENGGAPHGNAMVDTPDEPDFPNAGAGGSGSSVNIHAGITVFTHTGNDYSAPTIIHGGTLAAGAANVLSPNSDHLILPDGTLDLKGHNQTLTNLTNHGLIKIGGLEPRDGNPGLSPGAVLVITGEYIGENGTIMMNTQLGDDASPTDKLLIDGGSVTGNTFLQINNTGGLGASTKGNGILLIAAVNGGTTAPDSFTLDGQVKAGAFEYSLYHGGVGADADNDEWYLRSEGGTRIEVPTDVAVSTLAPKIGRSMVGTFFSRVGSYKQEGGGGGVGGGDSEQSLEDDAQHANLFWARVFGETGKGGEGSSNSNFGFGKTGPEYSYCYGGSQIGCDIYRSETDTLGLYLGFSTLHSKVKDADGNHAGKVTMDALSFGGYWTHYSPTGWYTDVVLQADWYTDIRSKSASGEEFSTHGLSLTASAEIGYVIELGKDEKGQGSGGLSLIPQAQFVYQYTNIQDASDSFAKIHYNATNQFYGRLGARLSQTFSSTGLTAWAEANLWHQFDSTAKTTFSNLDGTNPTTISTDLGSTWTQVVLGISVPINKHITLFATADYNLGLDQKEGNAHSAGGQVGIQIAW